MQPRLAQSDNIKLVAACQNGKFIYLVFNTPGVKVTYLETTRKKLIFVKVILSRQGYYILRSGFTSYRPATLVMFNISDINEKQSV